MANDFFQVPVLANGQQVLAEYLDRVPYNNGAIAFAAGDVVTGATSARVGTVIHVDGTTATGTLYILNTTAGGGNYSNGEDLEVSATKNAEASEISKEIYTQATHTVGANNPKQGQYVDAQGQAYMRFAEGAMQFDAFGRAQISQETILGEYINTYERDEKNWWYEEVGTGTVTHVAAHQGTLFDTGGTASGAKAASTTHLYHKYQLGKSQLVEITCALGDSGKTNVTRMWGLGDASDGLFFRLVDTTLQVYMRSSTVGDHVKAQADWNVDKLDGTGLSGMTLDLTKDNIYWFDYQWLGAGRVRFGVFHEGKRVTCHEMYHSNLYSQPYIRTGSLPIHHGVINTGIASGNSQMTVWCSVVKTEGTFEPQVIEHYHHIRKREKQNGGIYMAAVTNWHPGRAMFAIRPKLTINSITNRNVAYPVRLSVTNTGTDSMFIQARRGALHVGTPNWIDFHSESGLEYNEDDASNIDQDNRGVQVGMWSIPPQSTENISLTDVFGYRKEKIMLGADGTDQDSFTYIFTAWNMSAIAGGSDVGTYTVTFDNTAKTITKSAGTSWLTANYDGVAFADGQMVYIRNSVSNDGYYLIDGAPTATVITLKGLDGEPVTLTEDAGDVITLQGGTRSLFFGNLNVEEIE